MSTFPHFFQLSAMDCGPSCLKSIAKFYNREISIDLLRQKCQISRIGVSLLGISEAAEYIGLKTLAAKVSFEQLIENRAFPCIVHWNQNHFVIVYKIKGNSVFVCDPAKGNLLIQKSDFIEKWKQKNEMGVALFMEPTAEFFKNDDEAENVVESKWRFLFSYLKQYQKSFFYLFIGLLFSTSILLVTPFLTQILIDKGIVNRDLNLVYLILLGQLSLFAGSISIEMIRNWQLLHIGTKVNIALVSDFIRKLFKLPIKFHQTHFLGELIQRINDHKRLENLLTVKTISLIFATINLLLFGPILIYYNSTVFFIFISGGIIGILWILIFMRERGRIDYLFFELQGEQQGRVIDLLGGIEDIKISNSANQKRWEWEELQNKIYKLKIKALKLDQIQHNGFDIIIRLTGILLTIFTAKLVIENRLSLGTMFAINLILGQLSAPLYSFVDFIPAWQDAKLAMLRINHIHNQKNEETNQFNAIKEIPSTGSITFENVSFSYYGSGGDMILKKLNFEIERGKVTAIVGASGSGKSTLLKLLLKFFEPTEGIVRIGQSNFNELSAKQWRDQCGVVMQGGKVFSDTIVNNIALGQEIDMEQIVMTSALANLDDFVNSNLPMGYFTKIGEEGLHLSEGQKQRLLLARAMYKNPEFLILDEATSSLDAKNESEVMKSIADFKKSKTIIIVAHRLNTVRNADKILVLNECQVIESGTHKDLLNKKGFYFKLIKEQLT